MNTVPRRGLIDGLGDIFGTDNGSNQVLPTPTPTPTPTSSDPGLIGQIGSDLGNIGSAVNSLFSSVNPAPSSSVNSLNPSPSSSSTVSSVSNLSSSSSSIPSSSIPPSSSSLPPSSSSSSSTPLPSSPPPVSIPPPSSVSPSAPTFTSTSYTQLSPSSSTSPAAATNSPKSFLENKPLSGTIFGLIGLAVLIAIVVFITTCVRRRSRNRLIGDAANISFDPTDVEGIAASEKRYSVSRSGSRSGHGPAYISDQASSTGHGVSMVPDATFNRQDYGAASAAYMPNPYANYGNQVYQQPRSTSPVYGATAGYNGYSSNGTRAYGYTEAAAPAPPTKDYYQPKLPQASPLPERFGDDDVYGGMTSIDVMENHTANRQPRNLHVANE